MTRLPRTIALSVTCGCLRCRDKRIPLHVCVDWFRATSPFPVPPATPFQTFRFRCGRTVVITWGEIEALRVRMLPKAS